jgi:hypothetical protein
LGNQANEWKHDETEHFVIHCLCNGERLLPKFAEAMIEQNDAAAALTL